MRLLTWHGTLVRLPGEGGGILHHPLPLAPDGPPALIIDPAALFTEGRPVNHPDLGLIVVRPLTTGRGVSVARYGNYLCASLHQADMVFDRGAVDRWETFLPISARDLALLQHILAKRWIVRSTRAVIPRAAVRMLPGFHLQIGDHAIDLDEGLARLLPDDAGDEAVEPDRLYIADAGQPVELVVAGPRSSALIRTEAWPVRARRTAETLALAAHRQLCGYEPEQAAFERHTGFLMQHQGPAALHDLLEHLAPAPHSGPGQPDAGPVPEPSAEAVQASPMQASLMQASVMHGWAMREIAPWLMHPVDRLATHDLLEELNATRTWAGLYRFGDGDVQLASKPDGVALSGIQADRARHYLAFFQAVARTLPRAFQTTICMSLADTLPQQLPAPIFTFQKSNHAASVLVPDIDFLINDFYRDESFADTVAFADKRHGAVFAGSTTGGTITEDAIRTLSIPRLRAASYFSGHATVDFRLSNLVQAATPQAEALLAAQPYCQKPPLSWQEQFDSRFIVSMDGNGATCSRVAVALHSHAALVKYASPHLLYYFGGLQPWVHYVPAADDRDIDAVLAIAADAPGLFERIAENGRAFARAYLSRDAAISYMAALLTHYAGCLIDRPGVSAEAPADGAEMVAAPALAKDPDRSYVLAHIGNRGDRTTQRDGWTGQPGSGLWIEGFSIHFAPGIPSGGITYQAVLAGGALSEPASAGEFRGTRSCNAPVFGLRIEIAEDFDAEFEVTVETRFLDGSSCGPVSPGVTCKAVTGSPLEAIKLLVLPRVGQLAPD